MDGTDAVLSNATHTLKLYGKSVAGGRVAGMVRMALAKSGLTVKVTIRAEEAELTQAVLRAFA